MYHTGILRTALILSYKNRFEFVAQAAVALEARKQSENAVDGRERVEARQFGVAPCDLLLYVAGWPSSRQRVWHALLAARALENQVFCVGVNCAGWSADEAVALPSR